MGENGINFLQLVFDNIGDDIFLINKSGIILSSNLANFSERPIFDFIDRQHKTKMEETIQNSFNTKKSINLEIKAKMRNDKTGWFSVRISPVLKNNKVKSILLFLSDITEKRYLQLKRQKQIRNDFKKLKKKNRKLEDIIAALRSNK